MVRYSPSSSHPPDRIIGDHTALGRASVSCVTEAESQKRGSQFVVQKPEAECFEGRQEGYINSAYGHRHFQRLHPFALSISAMRPTTVLGSSFAATIIVAFGILYVRATPTPQNSEPTSRDRLTFADCCFLSSIRWYPLPVVRRF